MTKPGIPRTPEEFRNQTEHLQEEQRKEALVKIEKRNKDIGEARAMAKLFDTPAFKIFYKRVISDAFEELDKKSVSLLKGGVLELGGQVMTIQGGLAVLRGQIDEVSSIIKLAKETPVDVDRLKQSIKETDA